MKSLNPNPENCRRNGVFGLGLIPGHQPSTVTIKVSHGHNQYEVAVPFNSTFGYLKSVISQRIGLNPEMHKLLFRGKEKEDDEYLQTAGVQDNSVVLLVENTPCEGRKHEEVKENCVISKGEEAVAEVRKEVDKLEQKVFALKAVLDRGTKVDDKEIVYLTEMLMRQLLKLDGIEAEGDGKVQRKMEVRRVQSIVETLDVLKSRNSSAFPKTPKTLPVTTQPEDLHPSCASENHATTHWETFDRAHESMNSYNPPPVPCLTPSNVPYYHYTPYPMPSNAPYPMPPSDSYPMPSSYPYPYPDPYPRPYSYPYPMPPSDPMPYSDPKP